MRNWGNGREAPGSPKFLLVSEVVCFCLAVTDKFRAHPTPSKFNVSSGRADLLNLGVLGPWRKYAGNIAKRRLLVNPYGPEIQTEC